VPPQAVIGRVVAVERPGSSFRLDGICNRLWGLILQIPWVRSPLLPLIWRLLGRVKRACGTLTRPGHVSGR
jgi:hypothetical protein